MRPNRAEARRLPCGAAGAREAALVATLGVGAGVFAGADTGESERSIDSFIVNERRSESGAKPSARTSNASSRP